MRLRLQAFFYYSIYVNNSFVIFHSPSVLLVYYLIICLYPLSFFFQLPSWVGKHYQSFSAPYSHYKFILWNNIHHSVPAELVDNMFSPCAASWIHTIHLFKSHQYTVQCNNIMWAEGAKSYDESCGWLFQLLSTPIIYILHCFCWSDAHSKTKKQQQQQQKKECWMWKMSC